MQIEKITGKLSIPNEFPCIACNNNRAEFRGTVQHKGITVKLCLCPVCVNLPEIVLIETIFGKSV